MVLNSTHAVGFILMLSTNASVLLLTIELSSAENMSEQDIENKFSSLSLAFKTDRMTLHERLELQHRQRDISERNAEDEIRQLKTSVQCLNR